MLWHDYDATMLSQLITRTFRSAVAWSMFTAALRICSAIFVLPLVLRYLPTEELGLWYVFGSIGGLTALLDFGFNTTMSRTAGYVWAGAKKLQALGLNHGDAPDSSHCGPNYELLSRMVVTMRFYYRCLAAIVLFFMLTAGTWWIWRQTGHFQNVFSLRAAWFFFCLGCALNTTGSLWPSLLIGINGVREVQYLGILQLAINFTVVPVLLFFHFGLWAVAISQFLMGLAARSGGRWYFYKMAGAGLKTDGLSWDKELLLTLWPMAWRSGIVSVGTFLTLNANTLVCNAYLGLAETASYGLTMQVIGFLVPMSQVWIVVKFPQIAQLRAMNNVEEVARIFIGRMRIVIASYLLGAVTLLWIGNDLLVWVHAKTHMVPMPVLLALLAVNLLEMHHSQFGTLTVTENVIPFMKASIISGVAIVGLSFFITPHLGLWGIVLSFGGVQLCYNNWWMVWRGIQGINMTVSEYFSRFFLLNRSRPNRDT
jgi:O-antigen/teichoic acid export membrane protein